MQPNNIININRLIYKKFMVFHSRNNKNYWHISSKLIFLPSLWKCHKIKKQITKNRIPIKTSINPFFAEFVNLVGIPSFSLIWTKCWDSFKITLLFVVDYNTPATKNMKETNIWFTIVQNFIWSLLELFVDDAPVLYKACCWDCFCPKVERQICKVEHWPVSFY